MLRRRARGRDDASCRPMIIAMLIAHRDGADAPMSSGSIWLVLSMVAFALLLLAFAWSLLKPAKQRPPTAAEIAAERYAAGEIDADDFESVLIGVRSRESPGGSCRFMFW